MVKFIPEEPYSDTKSKAEIDFFYELKENITVSDAYVFHSVGLPKHFGKIFGEADFIILCRKGILCLEVKGGNVEYKKGEWIYHKKSGELVDSHKDPFKQAKKNIEAIRDRIWEKFPETKNKNSFAYGVVFPDIIFDISTVQYEKERVYDASSTNVNSYIYGLFDLDYKINKREELSRETVEKIADYIRPDFMFMETLASKLCKNEKTVLRLTRDQAKALDGIKANPHICIRGGAGTGKTVIAEEYARLCAKEGLNVLLLVYTKRLVYGIKRDLNGRKNITVMNIHFLFDTIVKYDEELYFEFRDEYYNEYWPLECIETLQKMPQEELEKFKYDVVILDEGQDLLKENNINVIDLILKGGIKEGKWAVFYDKAQNIFNKDVSGGMSVLQQYSITYYDLTENCRNTKKIAEYNNRVTGIDMPKLINNESGEDVEIFGYDDPKKMCGYIEKLMDYFEKEKIDKSDVVFLSPVKYENTTLRSAMPESFEINNFVDDNFVPRENVPVYSTIHSFKGMDSPIVILLDVGKTNRIRYNELLYTGISRAKSKLYIIARNEVLETMGRG